MSRLEDKVAVVIGVSAIYVECVQPVKAGDVPVISKAVAVEITGRCPVAGRPGSGVPADQECPSCN